MKTEIKQYNRNGNEIYYLPLPVICPHCSTVCDPIIKSMGIASNIRIIVLTANCCKRPFYAVYSVVGKSSGGTIEHECNLLTVYPSSISKTFDALISDLSPRFVELYNQAYEAEQRGHIDLAGTGYRSALEVLIKDFAIKYKGADHDKTARRRLKDVINEYYPVPDAKGLAHITRILGNDYTHYEQEYSDIEFNTFKEYVDGAVHMVYLHLLANKPLDTVE